MSQKPKKKGIQHAGFTQTVLALGAFSFLTQMIAWTIFPYAQDVIQHINGNGWPAVFSLEVISTAAALFFCGLIFMFSSIFVVAYGKRAVAMVYEGE